MSMNIEEHVIWGIIQFCKIFCKIMALFIFALDVLQVFTNDEKSWVRINYAIIPQ